MSSVATALQILAKAQAELRELIHRALAEGHYSDVAEIARIADGVARLAPGDDKPQTDDQMQPSAPPNTVSRPASILHDRRVRTSRAFPRFEREADKLVKIAWSKKDRAEYEHKAPHHVVDALLQAIRSRKGEGAKFEAPDVLPLKDPKTRREVPSYQSYLALAWLRHEGVVMKYGRDGYALKTTAATPEHLSELWEALPSRD
jgi:predicted lipid-binding transport protein (Tim44 family)